MRKWFALFVFVCLAFATEACMAYREKTVYLSPPPDVLYDAAIAIVKDMGFTITKDAKEPRLMLLTGGGYTVPNFNAEKRDEASGELILVHVYFKRVNVDTIAGISASQFRGDRAALEAIQNEIAEKLRAFKQRAMRA